MLAGFTGNKIETKTATIRALSDLVTHQRKEMQANSDQSSYFKSSEQTLIKILNIALQYLKEDIKSLHKAVLKMTKRVVSIISEENLIEVAKFILPQICEFNGKKDSIVYVK